MRTVFVLMLCLGICFANNETKENSTKPELSQKEKAYQAYLSKIEAENKKLEEDGFCSCNND